MKTLYDKYLGNEVHLADVSRFLVRKKTSILLSGFLTLVLTIFLLLSIQPKFLLRSSFKEAQQKSDSFSNNLIKSLFKNTSSAELGAQAQVIMQSRKILHKLIKETNLQVEIQPKRKALLSIWKENIPFFFEKKRKTPLEITCQLISYKGDVRKALHLKIKQEMAEVFTKEGALLCVQPLNLPFQVEDLHFQLQGGYQKDQEYLLIFFPLEEVIEKLTKKIRIKVRKEDPSVLDISYKDEDPFRGVFVLNTLMDLYKEYLVEENERMSSAQLAYLNQRQEDLSSKIEATLKEHVEYLQQTLGEKGFIGLHQELEMVENKKRNYQNRLLEIDLAVHKLQRLEKNGLLSLHEPLLGQEVTSFQKDLFVLKKQKDTIDLANVLRISEVKNEKRKKALPFLKVKKSAPSYSALLKRQEELEEKEEIFPVFSFMKEKNDLFLASTLDFSYEGKRKGLKLEEIQDSKKNVSKLLEKVSLINLEDTFYKEDLFRIKSLLDLKEAVLKKNLFVQEEVLKEFETLDLETARKMHVQYNSALDSCMLSEKELEYAAQNLLKKDFELSSLTLVLKDPISIDILQKSAQISLELKNERYLSEKDKVRLHASLKREKLTLASHINEMQNLSVLQKGILEEKIQALQTVITKLIDQEIAIVENQVKHVMQEKIAGMELEKEHLQKKIKHLHKDMKDLPSKWLLENKLQLKADLNVSMMEGLSELVEAKNIEYHLLQIESKPIDYAFIPLKPIKPPLVLLSILGGFFGILVSSGFLVLLSITKNTLPLSLSSLSYRNCKVAGVLSKKMQKEKDLEVLRSIAFFSRASQVTGFLLNEKVDFLEKLALLLLQAEKEVLIIQMYESEKGIKKGLLSYLYEKTKEAPIEKRGGLSFISMEESSKYVPELLSRKSFEEFLMPLKKRFDLIFLAVQASAKSAEAHALQPLCDKMVITLDQETLSDLYPFFEMEEEQQDKKICYVSVE